MIEEEEMLYMIAKKAIILNKGQGTQGMKIMLFLVILNL